MLRFIERWIVIEDLSDTDINSGWEVVKTEDGMILLIKECV